MRVLGRVLYTRSKLRKKAREERYNWLCCVGPLLLLQYELRDTLPKRNKRAMPYASKYEKSEAANCDWKCSDRS